MDFGAWLERKQAELGLNDKEFAEYVGIGQSTRSNYRHGAGITLHTLSKIAECLGIEILGEPLTEHGRDGQGPCSIADLRNCLERLYPNLPGDDVDEIVEIAQRKAERRRKAQGRAAAK